MVVSGEWVVSRCPGPQAGWAQGAPPAFPPYLLSYQGTLGEELYLDKKIFENQFFKYKKITKNILTVEKKFQIFS